MNAKQDGAKVATVIAREPSKDEVNLGGFQSPAARDAAKAQKVVAEDEVPVMGEQAEPPAPRVAVDVEDMNKLVPVKARENLLNFRVGPRTFSVFAGKSTLVPKYVKLHLEEKGYL